MIKKAILTGGGRATRLRPITTTINKHLILLAGKPMIFHAIEKVVKAGIKEIYINTNPGEIELQEVVGDGSKWGIKIQFFEQEGGPHGIAHVVKQAQKFIGDDPFMFYLSDNIILADLDQIVNKFNQENYDCMLALSQVEDPQRFGIPYFDNNNKLIDVIEKPENPPNNLAVTGIYLYGPKLFFEAFDNIKKSNRGEYEISSIHSYLLKQGRNVDYQEITGWWKDTGKPNDLLQANALLLDQMSGVEDKILIEEGVKMDDNVKITGPAIIGKNCSLSNCIIHPYTTIGEESSISNVEIKNSLIFSGCKIDCPITIENSLIGRGARIVKKEGNTVHSLILGDNTLVEM